MCRTRCHCVVACGSYLCVHVCTPGRTHDRQPGVSLLGRSSPAFSTSLDLGLILTGVSSDQAFLLGPREASFLFRAQS